MSYLIPAIALVGVIVLMALNKVTGEAGLAVISLIAGVHGGASVANSSPK